MCEPLQLVSLPTWSCHLIEEILMEHLSWVTFPCQEHVGERFRFVPRPLQIWGSSCWCLWHLGPSLFPLVFGENFLL